MNILEKGTISRVKIFLILLFALLTTWFLYIISQGFEPESSIAQLWSSTYQVVAWFGVVCGLMFVRLWGGRKSLVGRANLAFALGLLGQSIGQSVFSYYYFSGIEVPYPSVADIGFFGSIPLYIYGMYTLSLASGAKFSFRELKGKALIFIIPGLILTSSYFLFLRDYEFDWTSPLTIFLDFGYPLGQAIYLSFAITAYIWSKNFLGGIMKTPIIIFLVALAVQFLADYVFLYQVSREVYTGGIGVDYLYLLAYFAMSYSLISLGSAYYKIKNS